MRKRLPTGKRRYGKIINNLIRNKCICFTQVKPHVLPQASTGIVKSFGQMDMVRNDILKVDKCPGGYKYILVISVHFIRYT